MLSQTISTHGMIAHFCSGQWICSNVYVYDRIMNCALCIRTNGIFSKIKNEYILRFAPDMFIAATLLCCSFVQFPRGYEISAESQFLFERFLAEHLRRKKREMYGHHIASVNMRFIMLEFGMLYCSCATYHIIDIRYILVMIGCTKNIPCYG